MKILLVHQNFPGQFRHLAPALGADRRHRVVAFGMVEKPRPIPGVTMVSYRPGRGTSHAIHPWLQDMESKVIRGHSAMRAARRMRDGHGFRPDLIFAHHGWGEALFLKEIWPETRLLLYTEWYYPLRGADVGFDPEFDTGSEESIARLRVKNAHNLLSLEEADHGLSPTRWQRDTHPAWFRDRIHVIHDGIDTAALMPRPADAPLTLQIPADPACGIEAGATTLEPDDEIVTFVNRNLEPYRGYHVFMRALPRLLRLRPRARVVIVGGNGVSYGRKPETGTWKQAFLDEVRGDIDLSRVHFVGWLPYPVFVSLMQRTSVHVYLTYPFVLSWSLLEAMACGAAVVASDTGPVREVIEEGGNGRLAGFFDGGRLVDVVCELLDDPAQRARLGRAARESVVERYDLRTRCLPQQIALVEALGGMGPAG